MNDWYRVKAEAGDEATIELYGEIRDKAPVDWWTGQQKPGNYITPSGFKEAIAKVKGKSKITLKLDSLGGDLYVGTAIRSELKALKAHITVEVIGVAASAGSVIMTAGDKVKIHNGAQVMIHEAKAVVIEYADAEALSRYMNMLDSANRSMADLYAAKTGRTQAEILELMHAETWLTAEEAVKIGLCDEVIDGKKVQIAASADKKTLYAGAFALNMAGLKLPENIEIRAESPEAPAEKAAENTETVPEGAENNNGGTETVSEKIETVEALTAAYPDLVKTVTANAAAGERKRIQEIESIQATIGDKTLLAKAKFDEPMDARELAFANAQTAAKVGANVLQNITADVQAGKTGEVVATGNGGEAKKPEAQKSAEVAAGVVKELDAYFSKGGVK
jgi:ATP-dependent protease ClpP protease subunit